MWQKETDIKEQKDDKYKAIVKKAKKKKDNNLYLNIQIMFMAVILATTFVLKNSSETTYDFAKDSYYEFFETDTYMESTFSYNTFIEKMKNELQVRYGQLVTVFSYINGKGSADIYPDNVSMKKYIPNEKGVTPAQGYISSPYGVRTNPFNSKEKEFHTGLDIASSKGTFIRAAYDGTVIAADHNSTAGNYIRIRSDNEITTLYAHNQFLLVKEGEKVLAGQVIATMGDTGLATGPHLHFEFIVNGTRYNPIYAIDI